MYSVNLRALEPEDLELVYRIENDERLWPSSACSQPLARFIVRQYLQEQHADIYQDGQLRLVIEADAQPVGLADLTDFSPHHLRAEVGIVVLPEYHRQGIASAALLQLASYARDRLHLVSLYAYVAQNNEAARALFHRMGYHEACTLPKWIEGNQSATLYQYLLS